MSIILTFKYKLLFFLLCFSIDSLAQDKDLTNLFDIKIEEYSYPIKDTLNGFGWFYDFRGNLVNIITSFLNTSNARVRVKNNPQKYIRIKCNNNIKDLSHQKLTLDLLKANYKFSIKDSFDSVDVIEMTVLSDSLLIESKVKTFYPAEEMVKYANYIKTLSREEFNEHQDSLNKVFEPYRVNINKDSILLGSNKLCGFIQDLEEHSNFIFDCRILGYDDTETQQCSNGLTYVKYDYQLWVKKSLFDSFEELKSYFSKKGLKLEKYRRLEQIKFIEFENK
jgi:hypothetical protein